MNARGDRAWKPEQRDRVVSPALQAYAALTTSASHGAVRDVRQVTGARRDTTPQLQAK
jgi:dihydroxy-acid dehydratase